MRTLLVSTVAALALVTASAADEHGTPEEAQVMLQRVVEAIKADEAAALAAITARDPRFRDKDLYVFCGGMDGRITAHGDHETAVGQNLRNAIDQGGRPTGEEIYRAAVAGEVHTLEYARARPGEVSPSRKVAYVRKVADQVCAVGYYR